VLLSLTLLLVHLYNERTLVNYTPRGTLLFANINMVQPPHCKLCLAYPDEPAAKTAAVVEINLTEYITAQHYINLYNDTL